MIQILFDELTVTINKNLDNHDVLLEDGTGVLFSGSLTNEHPSVGNIKKSDLYVNVIRFSQNSETLEFYYHGDGITYKNKFFNDRFFL